MYRIGSLFSGIGGFDLGFQNTGFHTAWLCENDTWCQNVLRMQFPCTPLYYDVKNVKGDELPAVDAIVFGSPCQDLSLGRSWREEGRKGLDGERSGLFLEAMRIVREHRKAHGYPRFLVWENVPGALSSNGGRDFERVLDEVGKCGAKDIAWRVLDSSGFGTPQRRRRLFLVADLEGECAGEILALSESSAGHPPSNQPAGKRAESPGGLPEDDRRYFRLTAFGKYVEDGTASTLLARDWKDAKDLVVEPDGRVRRLMPEEMAVMQGFPSVWNERGFTVTNDFVLVPERERIKQIGNAVCVQVVTAIAEGMKIVLDRERGVE